MVTTMYIIKIIIGSYFNIFSQTSFIIYVWNAQKLPAVFIIYVHDNFKLPYLFKTEQF